MFIKRQKLIKEIESEIIRNRRYISAYSGTKDGAMHLGREIALNEILERLVSGKAIDCDKTTYFIKWHDSEELSCPKLETISYTFEPLSKINNLTSEQKLILVVLYEAYKLLEIWPLKECLHVHKQWKENLSDYINLHKSKNDIIILEGLLLQNDITVQALLDGAYMILRRNRKYAVDESKLDQICELASRVHLYIV
jgi:hypothetical protein